MRSFPHLGGRKILGGGGEVEKVEEVRWRKVEKVEEVRWRR